MLFCTVGFVLLPTSYVWANPAGEAVVGGAASFQRDGNKLTVNQTTDRLAVNWQSFNIGAGETTHFNMPSSTSAALNRVIGGNPSSIYGSLSANGILYLINPSGILVGPGGTVNAAAFMASTLDVSTEQFMNAKNGAGMNFYGSSGESIINQGNITAEKGDVFLIAQKVENRGTINAANGTAAMVGSGQNTDVMVHEVGGKGFAIRVAQLQGEAATGSNRDLPDGEELLNEGSINAAQAELNASGNVYALAIRNSGTIRAKAVVANADGTVRLDGGLGDVINTGRMYAKNAGDDAMAAGGKIDIAGQNITASPESIITAAGGEQGGNGGSVKIDSEYTTILQGKVDVAAPSEGAKGGKVQLLGERVGLFDGAKVDASGGAGGGTVLVGGDYLGGQTPRADLKDLAKQEAEPVKNAKATVMADTAEIKADATVNGNGGKVVLWSDNYTGFYGKIFARGGAKGGDGGFVETSSQRNLQAWGSVNVSSPKGRAGTWLIDPDDITIVGGSGTNNATNNGGSFTATTNGATVGAGAIVAALTNGSSVSVTTSGGGTNSTGDGNILVQAPISATLAAGQSASLTLTASPGSGQISGSGNISVGGGGSLNITFNADSIASYSGTIATAGGFFTANTVTGNQMSGSIATASGAVTINNTGAGAINLAGGGINAGAGAVNITQSGAQNIILAGLTSSRVVSITSQGGDIELNTGSYILTGATATFNANAGALTIDSGATFVGTTAALSLRGNGGITLDGDLFSNNAISLNSDNDSITVSNTGSITATGGTGNVNLGAGTGIILSGTIDSSASTGILTLQANGGSIQDGSGVGVLTPNNTTLTFIQASGGIRFNFGGNATFRAESTGAGVINIRNSVAGNNLTIAGNGIEGGATTVFAGGSLTLGSAGTFPDVGPLVRTTSFRAAAGVGGIIFGNGSTELFPLVQTTGLQQYDSPITLAPGVVPVPGGPTVPSQNWLQAGSILLGAVDAVVAGEADLGFAGTPDVNLAGLIGGLQRLNNFTTRGGSITFNVATSRATLDPAIAIVGTMSFDSADLILASSTWLSAGNDLIFGGDITGYRDGEFPVFQVNSGGGNVAFLGSIGNTAIPLGNLDVVSGSLTANSSDTAPGAAAGGEISIVGNIVTLPGTAPIIAGGNGNVGLTTYSATKGIVLSGDINTAGGGNYDDTMIGGALTLSTPLSDGSTPANIQVESNITTRGGAIDFEGPVFFTAASNLDTTVGNSGGAITFNDTTDGSAQATMNSGTAGISFLGNVGAQSNFNLAILGAGGVAFGDPDGSGISVLLGAGANTINSLAGDVVFGSTENPSTIDILNAGTLTMNLGNNSVDFYGEVGGTNPFGITVSSAGGINFEENVTLGGNFNLSSEGTGVNFNGTLNGDHSVTINSILGDISLGTVGDVIPIAGFSTSSGSGTLTLNGNISTEGGALSFGQKVTITSDRTIRTGLGLSPLGASISFAKGVLPSVAGIDLTINPGSNGSIIFADGLGLVGNRFNTFTLDQGGGLTIGGSSSGIFTTGNILIRPKVFGSFPKSTVNFNSENGDITLEQGAVLTGLFSGNDNNSDGSNFVAEAGNGTLTINGVLDVSGGENDTTSGGGSGYNSGFININAKNVVLNTLQALGGDADTVGNGGAGGKITIGVNSDDPLLGLLESLKVNSILADGGTGKGIVGGTGGDVIINRTSAVGEILIGTVSSRGGDSADSFGGNGGDITITAELGDLYAPTSFFTNGGEGSADAFAGLGGDVALQATVGNISFQNQSLNLTGDGGITIIAGKSIVFATNADFTTPSKSSGGVVITSNEDALRADRRGEISLQYGSANTAGVLYMSSSAYLISNGGKVAMDVKTTSGSAGAMTLSGISTSAADLNAGAIEINQNPGRDINDEDILGNVTISGSIDANGGDPASTGPRYGRNGGEVLISGLAVSVQQINTSGSASLATATVPAFGGSGGDVTITGTSILIRAGTVPATGSFAINTSGGTGQGTGNANGGSGGNIQLDGNVTLDSGDATKTTIIFNTQGGTFAAGGVSGTGGNITVTGTLTGKKTTSNTLDLRYGSGTVTLGNGLPTPAADAITLGTLITAADDARSTGSLIINGRLDLGTLTTYARGYGIEINGGGTIANAVTFNNTGNVALGSLAASTTFTSGLDSSAPATTQLKGSIISGTSTNPGQGTPLTFGAATLVDATTLDSNGSNVSLGTIDGGFDLTFASGIGSGVVDITSAVGASTRVGTITVSSGITQPVLFRSSVTAIGLEGDIGTTLSFDGNVNLTGGANLLGLTKLNNTLYESQNTTFLFTSGAASTLSDVELSLGPIEINGLGNYSFTGLFDGGQNLTLSGLGSKVFSGTVGGTTAIGTGTGAAITMSGGDVTFGTLITAGALQSIDSVNVPGELAANVIFGGDVNVQSTNPTDTTVNDLRGTIQLGAITFSSAKDSDFVGAVALTGDAILTGAGDYDLTNTLNGATFTLGLQGAGTKTFAGIVGGGAGLAGFNQIASSGTVTFQQNVTTTGVSNLGASTVLDGMTFTANGVGALGTTTMNGVTLSSGLVTLAGAGNYTVNGAMTGSQVLTLNDEGTKTFASTANIAGFTQVDGTGMATFQGNVTTSGASTFNSLVTLSGMTFSAGGLTILGNAAGDTITLNTGMVTLGGSGAYISNGVMTGAQALTLAGNNSKTFNSAVTVGNGTSAMAQADTAGNNAIFAENLFLNGASSFARQVTLDGMTVTASGATGLNTVVLSGGAVTLQGAGGYTTIGAVSGAQNFTLSGSGTKTFASTINSANLTQTGGQVKLGGNVTTTGLVDLANAATTASLTVASGSSTQTYDALTLGGNLSANTTSTVNYAVVNGSGNMATTAQSISVTPTTVRNQGTFTAIRSGGGDIVVGTGGDFMDAVSLGAVRSTGGMVVQTTGQIDAANFTAGTSITLDSSAGAVNVADVVVPGTLRVVTGGINAANFSGSSSASGFSLNAGTVNALSSSILDIPSLGNITLRNPGQTFSYSTGGNLTVTGQVNVGGTGNVILNPAGIFVNSYSGNPFTANSTKIITKDLFSNDWPSNGAVPGLQVVYGVNSAGQLAANQIGVSTTLLAGNAAPYILEFTTGTGQPYILAQQSAIPPVMLPGALTGGSGFARAASYSTDEIEMMTPEERSTYENQQRQISARVILQGESGEGEEIGAPTEGRTPQAASPAILVPVAPTAQVLLEGKPLAGAKSDQERGDATKIIKIRPTRAVALRSGLNVREVLESERMAAEVSVGAAPVAQSR